MPFALVVIGLLMIVTGAKDTHKDFAKELASEFTGQPKENFLWWIVAFGAIGAVGYAPQFRTFSRTFMGLMIVVLLLSNAGFFAKLQEAIGAPVIPPEKKPAQSSANPLTSDKPIWSGELPGTRVINDFLVKWGWPWKMDAQK